MARRVRRDRPLRRASICCSRSPSRMVFAFLPISQAMRMYSVLVIIFCGRYR